jgi:cysteine desulfurase
MSPIYLDYQATTPLAPEAAAAMRPWLEEKFANPHSSHRLGREAAAAVEVARGQVVGALSAPPPGHREGLGVGDTPPTPERPANNPPPAPPSSEGGEQRGRLHFTAGATEALNWALKGSLTRLPPNRRRIVTLATEHAAVLDTVEWLGRMGAEIDILPVGPDGIVDLDLAAERITDRTGIVAAMLVNNEIGVIQPVEHLAALARANGALFLCDAVQGFGRVPVPLHACDMVALSAHKVHGPKGTGALWVREGLALDPLLHGGGQEGGVRSGTLSPALCAGFGAAASLLVERGRQDHVHVARLAATAREHSRGWILNGSSSDRYAGNLNLRRPGVDAARLISDVRQVAFSAGSACASGSGRTSHVLRALGLGDAEARSSIRLGFGRYTSEEELVEALALINGAAEQQLSLAA